MGREQTGVNRQHSIISAVIKEAQRRGGVSNLDLEPDLEVDSREIKL